MLRENAVGPDSETESARVAAVRRYEILDTPPDGSFDRVARLAARVFQVPLAAVTFVDSDRIWFKARHGLDDVTEVSRADGLCGLALLHDGPMVIPDTRLDPLAATNPMVTGPLGIRFYAAAPIVSADGHKLGTVSIFDTRPRTLGDEDLTALQDLAQVVLDEMELRLTALRALRREQERRQAVVRQVEDERAARLRAEKDRRVLESLTSTLQRTLLPPALPAVPGLELACHYHAASVHDLGGDFYDVFPLDGDRWAFLLGDVCGKGPDAATVTALARHTLRAAAHHAPDPVAVLDTLNTELLGDSLTSKFCTAIFGVLTPREEGGFEVEVATGGHPPAYHVAGGPDGVPSVSAVSLEGGMLIGALPEARFRSRTVVLAPGEVLLLYTDGLIEARAGEDRQMIGDEGLAAFLARRRGLGGAAGLVEDIVDLLDSLPEGAEDDVALLALSVPTAEEAERRTPGVTSTAHTTTLPTDATDEEH
ncbi:MULTISPECIES: PP2C family protein-serine/threonine phosphatase [Streptomyces]|uniref:GAF domain-containing SpoIIE family protein phosphatase n=1 Tax=Streptomyces chilikensis TaxID=1194079 RepID=A0ABV3EU47_9ACTN|nr:MULTISPECIES: GAF domain-containing SpoIIE family protein phosphatase [Streptomyces]MDH6225845.1 sigma-B regulation protein RsbU (phosphoserine phosphatase) [Streptomyces sp. MJP52]